MKRFEQVSQISTKNRQTVRYVGKLAQADILTN